jgi:hypothetical protein
MPFEMARNDVYGSTKVIRAGDGSEIQILRSKRSGEFRTTLQVKSSGEIIFTNYTAGFRRSAQINPLDAKTIIGAGSVSPYQTLSVETAAEKIQFQVQQHFDMLAPQFERDEKWPPSSRRPQPLESLADEVGVDIPYGFGATRLIFQPHGRALQIKEVDGNGKVMETIEISSKGEVRRRVGASEQYLVSHLHESVSDGILAYAYHYSALGGRDLHEAMTKVRDFLIADVPELFDEELPRRLGFVRGTAASRPVAYDPTKGLDQ